MTSAPNQVEQKEVERLKELLQRRDGAAQALDTHAGQREGYLEAASAYHRAMLDLQRAAVDALPALLATLSPPEASLQGVERLVEKYVLEVNEYDDRTSPEDWPEALLITSDELHSLLKRFAAEFAALSSLPSQGVEQEEDGRVPQAAPGSRPTDQAPQAGLDATRVDPSRGEREQAFERFQIANGCVVPKCDGCMNIVCADYLSDNCACMDDYEAEIARRAVAELTAEMERRDRNEARNCLNWGPCSRHDGHMCDSDRSGEAIETSTKIEGSTEGESAAPKGIAQTEVQP